MEQEHNFNREAILFAVLLLWDVCVAGSPSVVHAVTSTVQPGLVRIARCFSSMWSHCLGTS